jgi:hypothetical protein
MQEESVSLARASISLIRASNKGILNERGSVVDELGFIKAREGANSVINRRPLRW